MFRNTYRSRVHHNPVSPAEQSSRAQPFFNFTISTAIQRKPENAFFQPKLTVGQRGDKYEKDADAVSDAVVANQSAVPVVQQNNISSIQRLCPECEKEKKSGLQRKEAPIEEMKGEDMIQNKPDGNGTTASSSLSGRIEASSGKGQQLPSKTLQQMQASFGVDFSNVNIHTDAASAQMNQALHAQAFAHGSDIYFNSGKYDTNSSGGKHLLAHELTHVVQQNHFSKQRVVQKQDDPVPTDTASTAPLVQQPVPQTMTCVPVGLSRADFLSVNGNDVSEFGHTLISVTQTMLNPTMVTFQRVGRSRRVKPMPIVVNLPAIESFYTQAGIFYEGSQRVVFGPEDDCLTDTYSLQWRISSDGASKIREGEQEHCDDYNYAYANSVLPFVTEVNRLASGSRTFGSERAGKRYLQRVIGFNPDDWFTRFSCLLRLSLQRDRVTRGFTRSSHDPIPFTNAPNRYNRCRHATVSITARSLPQVGQIGSAAIITGC